MTVSTVPAVLDALVTLARTALPDTDVIDGMPVTTDSDFVAIGFGGISGEDAVEATQTLGQMAAKQDLESYGVACVASTWSGDTDPKAVRDRAYGLVDAFAAELRTNKTLNGTVMRASLSAVALAQEQTEQGALATVRFAVRVDAFVRP